MATEVAAERPKLDVDEYLTSALSATPAELHPYFTAFKDLHSRKYVIEHIVPMCGSVSKLCRLWHQLTRKLGDFFDEPLSRSYRVDVFDRFVRDFEAKLNQLRLVEMGVKVAREIDSRRAFVSCRCCITSLFRPK